MLWILHADRVSALKARTQLASLHRLIGVAAPRTRFGGYSFVATVVASGGTRCFTAV